MKPTITVNTTSAQIVSGASLSSASADLLLPALHRFRAITTILVVVYNRHLLRPEESRDLIQRALAYFAGGVTLTPEERVATTVALRRLKGTHDDWATACSGYAPLGQWGGFIVTILGALGKAGTTLPNFAVFGLIIFGMLGVALGTWASGREKTLRKPEAELKLLIDKIEKSASPPTGAVESWSAPFCDALNIAFEEPPMAFEEPFFEVRKKIVALYLCDDHDAAGLAALESIAQLRTVERKTHRAIGFYRCLGSHLLLLNNDGLPAIFHEPDLPGKRRFVSLPPPPPVSPDSVASKEDASLAEYTDQDHKKATL